MLILAMIATMFAVMPATAFAEEVAGSLSTVYLNGASGADTNAGDTSGAAVKTFAKAKELLAKDGTIYITGTVTISDTQTWSLPSEIYGSAVVMRDSSYKSYLVTVTAGSITLENIIIDGNNSNVTTGSPLIYLNNAAAVLTMNDGAVLRNNKGGGGCGVNIAKGTFTMNGGTITGNTSSNLYGGGVYVNAGYSFIMNGGTITGNTAKYGGGVGINNANASSGSTTFTMNGGTITNNTATASGSAIFVYYYSNNILKLNDSSQTTIDGIYISSSPSASTDTTKQSYVSIGKSLVNTLNLEINIPAEGRVIAAGIDGYTLTDADRLKINMKNTTGWYTVLDTTNNKIYLTATAPGTPTYNITASASTTGGAISPAGVTTVDEGKSKTYSITPESGCTVASVTVDGVSVGSVPSYTFTNVTTDHSISASFALIPPPLLSVGTAPAFYVGMDYYDDTLPKGQTVTITNISENAVTLTAPGNTDHFEIGLSDTAIPAGGTVTMTVTPQAAAFLNENGDGLSQLTTFNNVTENTVSDTMTIGTADGSFSTTMAAVFHVQRALTVTLVAPEHGTLTATAVFLDETGKTTNKSGFAFTDTEEKILASIDGVGGVGGEVKVQIKPNLGYERDNQKIITYSDKYPEGTVEIGTEISNGFGLYNDLLGNVRIEFPLIRTTFIITSSAITSGGSISDGGTVGYGDDRAFTITPDPGYHIDKVYVDTEATTATIDTDTGIGTYTFDGVTAKHTIEASFAANSYEIAFDKNADDATGTMGDLTGLTYGTGTNLTACGFTRDGFKFLGWTTDPDSAIAAYKDGVMVDLATTLNGETETLYAVWADTSQTFRIESSVLHSGGMITAGGYIGYDKDAEFTITPDKGYHIYEIDVDAVPAVAKIDDVTGVGKYTFLNVTEEHTIEASFEPNDYSIEFNKNAGDATSSMDDLTGITYGTARELPASAFARSGYSFAGWSTDKNSTAAAYSDKAAVNIPTVLDGDTVVLYAIWTKDVPTVSEDEGGSGGGGGGSTEPSGGITVVKDNSGTQTAVIAVDSTASTNAAGAATANVDGNTLSTAWKQAAKAAAENDKSSGSLTGTTEVEVKVEVDVDNAARSLEASMPADILKEMAQQTNVKLTVSSPIAEITFDQKALSAIAASADDKVSISVEKINNETLSAETRQKIGEAPVYELKALVGSGTVSNFNGGTATISVPYELKQNESAADIAVYYIDSTGTMVKVVCTYDAASKTVTFVTGHFSYYTIVSLTGAAKFTDISATAWYYAAANYAVENGLFNGTSATTFSPDTAMTRAMFVTALGRISGVNASDYSTSSFSDVDSGNWCGGYVQWAYENKIISGVGDGRFAPNQAITREQMASILNNYCQWKNGSTDAAAVQLSYTDSSGISSWAKEGVMLCTGKQWLTGYPDGSFRPAKTATRAEVAVIIQRYVQTQ